MDAAPLIPRLTERFKRREALSAVKHFAMLIFGLPLTLIGPLLLATVFWFACLRLTQWDVSWLSFFFVLTAITVPLLFRLELRTAGRYFDEATSNLNEYAPKHYALLPHYYRSLGVVAGLAANPRASSASAVELFLSGPRLILGAWRGMKARRMLANVDRTRAAQVVGALLSLDHALGTKDVLQPGEELTDLLPVLAYLAYHRFVGVGDDMNKVWLSSEAREELRRLPTQDGYLPRERR